MPTDLELPDPPEGGFDHLYSEQSDYVGMRLRLCDARVIIGSFVVYWYSIDPPREFKEVGVAFVPPVIPQPEFEWHGDPDLGGAGWLLVPDELYKCRRCREGIR